MSQHDPAVALRQMLDHAREAVALAATHSRADLDSDRIFNLALIRLLEILGEAANRVPHEVQDRHPEIPWARLISLRNRLIHAYDYVDHDIIWHGVTIDLPPIVAGIEQILSVGET
jgi:uncharacterized protein with HEPN domain